MVLMIESVEMKPERKSMLRGEVAKLLNHVDLSNWTAMSDYEEEMIDEIEAEHELTDEESIYCSGLICEHWLEHEDDSE